MIQADQFPLLDHISSGILAIDEYGTIVLWNKTMEQWSNISRQKLLGKNLFEQFPGTASAAFKTRIEQVINDGTPVIFSSQLHHHMIPCQLSDGQFRTQRVTATWLNTQRIALFSIEDQTEQARLIEKHQNTARQLQEELNQRQQLEAERLKLATAIEQAGEAVIITDRQGRTEYINRAFTNQTGWNLADMQNHAAYSTLFKHQDEYFSAQLDQLLAEGHVWQDRQQINSKDGSSFTASISIAPIVNESGELTHHIIIQEDISQHIAMEEKFRHTQKQEALITLIGGIAHDFNNLLAGLVGQLYLASREVANMPKTAGRMKKAQIITQEAAEIVKQLLTFARQGEHHSKEFPLSSFIKEFMKLARHTVPENIALIPQFEAGSFAFRGDANQLQQALLNIVQNAVDACTEQHDASIEIGLAPFNSDEHAQLLNKYPVLRHGNFAHILIRDNGTGIEPELLEKIFDPFFSTRQLGSGLGLAMVMGCVRHHHGIVDVESSPQNGTCMHLFLPTLKPRLAITPDPQSKHSSANILLVDDDMRVLEPTKELLECMGHQVTLAKDGVEACEVFATKTDYWDIVITDMVMPRMNGLEASINMRQLRPDIPVIYATGYDQSLITDNTRKMHNSKLISKPFGPDELDALISRMLKKNR